MLNTACFTLESIMLKTSTLIKLLVLFFCVNSTQFLYADKIYKSVDKNGNVTYSDSPSKNANVHKLPEILSIPPLHDPKLNSQQAQTEHKQAFSPNVKIIYPKNQATLIAAKNGDLTITTSLTQPLTGGYSLALYADGEQVIRGIDSKFKLNNQNRGEHIYEVRLLDPQGDIISRDTITLYVQRQKVSFKAPKSRINTK